MLYLAWTGISSFSLLPLRISFVLSVLVFLSALLYLVYILYTYCSGNAVPGWSSLLVAVLLFGSLQLLLLGIIGEYIGKTYMHSKQRPPYVINEQSLDVSTKERHDL